MPAKTQAQIDYDQRQKLHIQLKMRWAIRNGYPLPTREWKHYRYRVFPHAVTEAWLRSDGGRINIPCPVQLVKEGELYPDNYPVVRVPPAPVVRKPEPKYPLRMDTDIPPAQVYEARAWMQDNGFDVGSDPNGMPYDLFLAYLQIAALND